MKPPFRRQKSPHRKEAETSLAAQWSGLCLPMLGVQVRSLVGDPESRVPSDQKTKTWNRSNIVTKSIKTLKMVHIKKKTNQKGSNCTSGWTRLGTEGAGLPKVPSFISPSLVLERVLERNLKQRTGPAFPVKLWSLQALVVFFGTFEKHPSPLEIRLAIYKREL